MQVSRALLVAAGLSLAACGQPVTPLNVVLITLDTTRADHFGFAGYERARTPNFDAFAAYRATRFSTTLTAAPITLPAHSSIVTGTYPVFHGVHDNDAFFLDDKVTTLAEILRRQGFTTGAVVAAYPLDSQVNLDQGFDSYDDDLQADWTPDQLAERTALSFGFVERKSDLVNRAVARWLGDHAQERFFLWVHYFDPHQPYDPPPPYDTEFVGNPYDGEIAFMDESFGKLLGMLDARGLLDHTVLVVVGDHGESLDQHGEPTHAHFVYDATLRVPLLVAVPGDRFPVGGEVRQPVRTIDVAPTILDLLGLPAGDEMQGRSLVPLLAGEPTPPAEAMLESFYPRFHYGWAPLRALRTERWKLIEAPRLELYDLAADPDELVNVAAREPQVVAELGERLARLARQSSAADPARSSATQVSDETRAKLLALGYLASSGGTDARELSFPAPAELATMINPVERSLVLKYVNFSFEMLRAKRFEEALPVLRNGLAIDPANFRLRLHLARAHAALGLFDTAVTELAEARRARPEEPEVLSLLGRIYINRGQWNDAVEVLEEAVRLGPQEVDNLQVLAAACAAVGRDEEAIRHFQAVLDLDDRNWGAMVDLAELHRRVGQWEEARQLFERALAINPYSAAVRYRIALFYRTAGDSAFSRQMFESVLQVAPDHGPANAYLGEQLLSEGQPLAAARPYLERAVRSGPQSPWGQRAQALLDGAPPAPATGVGR